MKNVIVLVITAFVSLSFIKSSDSGYKVGDKATDFKLKNIDGKMLSLADVKTDKGYIVIFTCNHCPFSKAYEDRIIELDKKYKKKGYPVVAINPNDVKVSPEDSFDKMIERSKEKKFSFPYLYDETQNIAKTYGATRTPHVYVLTKKGKDLVVEYIGAIDDNAFEAQKVQKKYLETALDELVAGKAASNNFTKAIGCTIKWSGMEE